MDTLEKQFETEKGFIRYWISPGKPEHPWLVFLPGLSADHHLFDQQVAFFAGEYPCLVWDAPAHAASRPFPLSFTMDDMAAYLHGILKAEGIEKPVLIGQSLGGYIAQCYFAMYPGSASGFVSIDSAPLSRKYFSGWELAALKHTKGMYTAIPWKLLLKWGILGTSRTPYGRELMEKTWAVYSREDYLDLTVHGFRILNFLHERASVASVLLVCQSAFFPLASAFCFAMLSDQRVSINKSHSFSLPHFVFIISSAIPCMQ